MTSPTWVPRREKSADRIEGATRRPVKSSAGGTSFAALSVAASIVQIGRSIELPQCWQRRSSEVLMRTIV